MALVLLEKADGIATITLNRPEAMNALSHGLAHGILRGLPGCKGRS